jgi:hypothetical protein
MRPSSGIITGQEHHQRQRNALGAVAHEVAKSLAMVDEPREVAGDEEEQRHPEQVTEAGDDPDRGAGRSVGHDPFVQARHERQAGVKVDAQKERERTQSIQRVESIGRIH